MMKREWFVESDYLSVETDLPTEVRAGIELLRAVPRYKHPDYPPGIFEDNSYLHTCRCVERARRMGLPEATVITLMIHDIGEIIAGDVTAIEKEQSPALAAFVARVEGDAVDRVLTKDHKHLYQTFEQAGTWLKGEGEYSRDLDMGIYSQLIDKTDGNTKFHYDLTRWLASNSFSEGKQMPELSLIYTFTQAERFLKRLEGVDNDVTIWGRECLFEELDFVRKCWKSVDTAKVPPTMTQYL